MSNVYLHKYIVVRVFSFFLVPMLFVYLILVQSGMDPKHIRKKLGVWSSEIVQKYTKKWYIVTYIYMRDY